MANGQSAQPSDCIGRRGCRVWVESTHSVRYAAQDEPNGKIRPKAVIAAPRLKRSPCDREQHLTRVVAQENGKVRGWWLGRDLIDHVCNVTTMIGRVIHDM